MSVAISWASKKQLAKCDIMVGFRISSHIYVIYKPWQLGVYNKHMTWVQSQRKYAVDKPWAQRVRGLSMANIWWPRTRVICLLYIHCNGHGSYDIYYDEVILGYIMVYYATKTCNYSLVLTVSLCQVILQHLEATISNHVRSSEWWN